MPATKTPGAAGRLTDEQQRLVSDNLILLVYLLGLAPFKKYRVALGWEEAKQEGALGLCQAALKFDPTRGHRFSTLAQWHVLSSLQRALWRRSGLLRRRCEVGGLGHTRTFNPSMFGPELAAFSTGRERNPGDVAADRIDGKAALAVLCESERRVIGYLADGMTLEDAGELMGFSRQRAYQILARARKKVTTGLRPKWTRGRSH